MPKIADRVKETTTTTGTGAYSLAGAVAGFRAFSAAFVTTDTVYYCVENGADWEVGIGTLTSGSPWTMARTTILASSNSGSAVSWAAGTKNVFVTVPSGAPGIIGREVLTAARTYYVRTDGSDSNNGLSNTSGGAFLTIQKAVDVVCTLDCGIYAVTIQVGDGTFNGAVALKKPLGSGEFQLLGNTTTPSNCVVNNSSGDTISNTSGAVWTVGGFKLTSTSGYDLICDGNGGVINVKHAMDYGQSTWSHIAAHNTGTINVLANYTVSGGSTNGGHWHAMCSGTIQCNSRTVTITNTPNFPAGWAWVDRAHGTISCFSCTFSGSATGLRYNGYGLGCIFTNGTNANSYLPGTSGSLNTGSVYA